MNSLGWAIIFKIGCLCTKETITINGTKYVVCDHIAQGYVDNNSSYTYLYQRVSKSKHLN